MSTRPRFKLPKLEINLKTPLEQAVQQVLIEQQKWLNKEMERISPPEIFAAAMDGTAEGAEKAKVYYESRGIHIKDVPGEHGLSKQIWERDRMISESRFVRIEGMADE